MEGTVFQDSIFPILRLVLPKQIAYLLSQPAAHFPFRLKPKAKEPVSKKPREGCGCTNPVVIEFEIGLKFSDLHRFAEFSLKDCLYADRVSRFDENRESLDGQEFSDSGQFLGQTGFIGRADLHQVAQQLLIVERLRDGFFA